MQPGSSGATVSHPSTATSCAGSIPADGQPLRRLHVEHLQAEHPLRDRDRLLGRRWSGPGPARTRLPLRCAPDRMRGQRPCRPRSPPTPPRRASPPGRAVAGAPGRTRSCRRRGAPRRRRRGRSPRGRRAPRSPRRARWRPGGSHDRRSASGPCRTGPARRRPGRSRAGAGASCRRPRRRARWRMSNRSPATTTRIPEPGIGKPAENDRARGPDHEVRSELAHRDRGEGHAGQRLRTQLRAGAGIAQPRGLAAADREHGLGIVGQHGPSPAIGADAVRPINVHRHVQTAVGLGWDRQPAGHGDDLVADLAIGSKAQRPGDRMNRQAERARREAGSAERLDIRSEAGFGHRFGRGGARSLRVGGGRRRRTAHRRGLPRR